MRIHSTALFALEKLNFLKKEVFKKSETWQWCKLYYYVITKHPGGDGGHPLCVGGHVGGVVEDVDKDKEQGDQQGHAPRYNLHNNK